MCGKIWFGTKNEAKKWIKDKKKNGYLRGKLWPYLCIGCGRWCTTSTGKKTKKVLRQVVPLKVVE